MKHEHKNAHRQKLEKKLITTNSSILITSILIIISTLIYEFEIAGQTFYLRYIILSLAIIMFFDALTLQFKEKESIAKTFYIIKTITGAITLFILFILIYYIVTIPIPTP